MSTVALSGCSGATLGGPTLEDIAANSASSYTSTSSTASRIRRIRSALGIKASVLNEVSIAICRSGFPRTTASRCSTSPRSMTNKRARREHPRGLLQHPASPVVGGRGELQRLTDRLDPEPPPELVDEGHYFLCRR